MSSHQSFRGKPNRGVSCWEVEEIDGRPVLCYGCRNDGIVEDLLCEKTIAKLEADSYVSAVGICTKGFIALGTEGQVVIFMPKGQLNVSESIGDDVIDWRPNPFIDPEVQEQTEWAKIATLQTPGLVTAVAWSTLGDLVTAGDSTIFWIPDYVQEETEATLEWMAEWERAFGWTVTRLAFDPSDAFLAVLGEDQTYLPIWYRLRKAGLRLEGHDAVNEFDYASLQHPDVVLGMEWMPANSGLVDPSEQPIVIMTSCQDGVNRIWSSNMGGRWPSRFHQAVAIDASVFTVSEFPSSLVTCHWLSSSTVDVIKDRANELTRQASATLMESRFNKRSQKLESLAKRLRELTTDRPEFIFTVMDDGGFVLWEIQGVHSAADLSPKVVNIMNIPRFFRDNDYLAFCGSVTLYLEPSTDTHIANVRLLAKDLLDSDVIQYRLDLAALFFGRAPERCEVLSRWTGLPSDDWINASPKTTVDVSCCLKPHPEHNPDYDFILCRMAHTAVVFRFKQAQSKRVSHETLSQLLQIDLDSDPTAFAWIPDSPMLIMVVGKAAVAFLFENDELQTYESDISWAVDGQTSRISASKIIDGTFLLGLLTTDGLVCALSCRLADQGVLSVAKFGETADCFQGAKGLHFIPCEDFGPTISVACPSGNHLRTFQICFEPGNASFTKRGEISLPHPPDVLAIGTDMIAITFKELPGHISICSISPGKLSMRIAYQIDVPEMGHITSLEWQETSWGMRILLVGGSDGVRIFGRTWNHMSEKSSPPLTVGTSWEALVKRPLSTPTTQHYSASFLGHHAILAVEDGTLHCFGGALVSTTFAVQDDDLYTTNLGETSIKLAWTLPEYHPFTLYNNLLWGNKDYVRFVLAHIYHSIKLKAITPYVVSSNSRSVDDVPAVPLNVTLQSDDLDKMLEESGADALQFLEDDFSASKPSLTLTASEYRELPGLLDGHNLTRLNAYERIQLLCFTEAFSEMLDSASSLDTNGFLFAVLLKFHLHVMKRAPGNDSLRYLPSLNYLWAFFSESPEALVEMANRTFEGGMLWEDARMIGLGFWLHNPVRLRTQVEQICRNTFNKSADRDPTKVSLFYLALGMKTLLQRLWKMASHNQEGPAMQRFLAHDFSEERWRKAALKNAFVLMGKQRHEFAASFFLLGGALEDCMNVCIRNLKDLQLALVVATLYEGPNGPVMRKVVHERLENSEFNIDTPTATILKWRMEERGDALRDIENELYAENCKDRPSWFLLYHHLNSNQRTLAIHDYKFPKLSTMSLMNKLVYENEQRGLRSLGLAMLRQARAGRWKFDTEEKVPPWKQQALTPASPSFGSPAQHTFASRDPLNSGIWSFGDDPFDAPMKAPDPDLPPALQRLTTGLNPNVHGLDLATSSAQEGDDNGSGESDSEEQGRISDQVMRKLAMPLISRLLEMVTSLMEIASEDLDSTVVKEYEDRFKQSCQMITSATILPAEDVEKALLHQMQVSDNAFAAVTFARTGMIQWGSALPIVQSAIEAQVFETQQVIFQHHQPEEYIKYSVLFKLRAMIWACTACPEEPRQLKSIAFAGARLAVALYMLAMVRWQDYLALSKSLDLADKLTQETCLQGPKADSMLHQFQSGLSMDDESSVLRETDYLTKAGVKSLSDAALDYIVASFFERRLGTLLVSEGQECLEYVSDLIQDIRSLVKRLASALKECWHGEPEDTIKDWLTSDTRRRIWGFLEKWLNEKHVLREVLRESVQAPLRRTDMDEVLKSPSSGRTNQSSYTVAEPATVFKSDTAIFGFCVNKADPHRIALACNKMILELDVDSARTYLHVKGTSASLNKAVTAHNPEYLDVATSAHNYRSEHALGTMSTLSRSLSSRSPSYDGNSRTHSAENLKNKFKKAMHQFPKSRSDHASLTQLEIDDGVRQRFPVNASCLEGHPQYPFFVSGFDDSTRGHSLCLWQFGYTKPLTQYNYEGSKLVRLHYDTQGERFGALEFHGELNLFVFDSARHSANPFQVLHCHPRHAFDFAFLSSSSLLATVGTDQDHMCHMSFWDTLVHPRSSRVANMLLRDVSQHMVYVPRHHSVFVGNRRGEIEVHDIRQQSFVTTLPGHTGIISSLTLDEEQDMLYSGSAHGDIKAWNLKTLEEIYCWNKLHEPKGFISSIFDRMPMGASGTVHMAPTTDGILSASADGVVTNLYRPVKDIL